MLEIDIEIKQPDIFETLYEDKITYNDNESNFDKLYEIINNLNYDARYDVLVSAKTYIDGRKYSTGFEYDNYTTKEELERKIKEFDKAIMKTNRYKDKLGGN